MSLVFSLNKLCIITGSPTADRQATSQKEFKPFLSLGSCGWSEKCLYQVPFAAMSHCVLLNKIWTGNTNMTLKNTMTGVH